MKDRFDIYDKDEYSTLGLMRNFTSDIKEVEQKVDNKTDKKGNHEGSWQGINRPTLSEEGMRGTVEKIIDVDIPNLNKEISSLSTNLLSNFASIEEGIKNSSGKTLLIDDKEIEVNRPIIIENVDNLNIVALGSNSHFKFTIEEGARILFKNCNNLRIDGLRISTSLANLRYYNNTCGIEIENCNRFIVENIEIKKHSGMGILITSSNDGEIKNNKILNTMADGIHIANSNGNCSENIKLYNNYIENSGDDGIACVGYKHNSGLQNRNIIAYSNTIKNSKARGMSIVGGKNVRYYSNTIDGTSGSGVIIIQDYVLNDDGAVKYSSYENENCYIYDNTLKLINKITGQGYPNTERPVFLVECYEQNFKNKNIDIYDNNITESNYSTFLIRAIENCNVRNNTNLSSNKMFGSLINTSNTTIDNNTITIEKNSVLSNVISFTNCNNLKIKSNVVKGGVGSIILNGNEVASNNLEFTNNNIEFNTINNSSVGGCGFGNVVNLVCKDNFIYSNNISAYDINLSNISGDIIIKNNKSKTPNNAKTLVSTYNTIEKQDVEIFKTVWGLSIPTTGNWRKGDIVYNYNPTPGNYIGWICTEDGTPGTWKRFGQIES